MRIGDETDGLGRHLLSKSDALARPFLYFEGCYTDASHNIEATHETGFVGPLIGLVDTFVDLGAGTTATKAKTAADLKAAEQAKLRQLQLQSQMATGPGLIPGVPNWMLALGGAGLLWFLFNRGVF